MYTSAAYIRKSPSLRSPPPLHQGSRTIGSNSDIRMNGRLTHAHYYSFYCHPATDHSLWRWYIPSSSVFGVLKSKAGNVSLKANFVPHSYLFIFYPKHLLKGYCRINWRVYFWSFPDGQHFTTIRWTLSNWSFVGLTGISFGSCCLFVWWEIVVVSQRPKGSQFLTARGVTVSFQGIENWKAFL